MRFSTLSSTPPFDTLAIPQEGVAAAWLHLPHGSTARRPLSSLPSCSHFPRDPLLLFPLPRFLKPGKRPSGARLRLRSSVARRLPLALNPAPLMGPGAKYKDRYRSLSLTCPKKIARYNCLCSISLLCKARLIQ